MEIYDRDFYCRVIQIPLLSSLSTNGVSLVEFGPDDTECSVAVAGSRQ
jgi:hypothetical protein